MRSGALTSTGAVVLFWQRFFVGHRRVQWRRLRQRWSGCTSSGLPTASVCYSDGWLDELIFRLELAKTCWCLRSTARIVRVSSLLNPLSLVRTSAVLVLAGVRTVWAASSVSV